MDVSDIRIFMAVARLGSVSKAANELGYVQSNITARIRSIEQEIGRPLFHRHRRGMTLNVEGRKLLTYGDKLLKLMNEINHAFQDENDPSGTLKIGLVEGVPGLPDLLSVFHRNFKKVDLSIVSGVSEDLIEEVLEWKLDGALVAGPVHVPYIDQIPLFEDEIVLVCGTSREESRQIQSVEELLHLPFLVFKEGCRFRAGLQKWAYAEGIAPLKKMEFGTLETILGTVIAGLGVTLLSRTPMKKLEKEGLVRLFQIPEEYRHVSFVYIRRSDAYLGEAERRFINTVSKQ